MARDSLRSLAGRMKRRANQMERTVETAIRQGALAALRAATVATPVDTGNARVNWNLFVKDPKIEIRPLPTGVKISKAEANKAVSARARFRAKKFKVDDETIWLTNGVRYIRGLDTGNVSKKGGQMSAKAVIAGRKAIAVRLAKGIFTKPRKQS